MIGGRGFHGSMSGFNIWSVPMDRDDLKHLSIGCNVEKGDISAWSDLTNTLLRHSNLTSPPTCLDSGGKLEVQCMYTANSQ